VDARPWILGVSYSHNGAACLLHGDQVVVAIQEERLSGIKRARIRHHQDSLAVRYCLDAAGLTMSEVDLLVACHFSSASPPLLALPDRTDALPRGYATVTHHLGHAHAVFSTSGFAEAAVLVVDGQGGTIEQLPVEERTPLLRGHVPGQRLETEVISVYRADDRALSLVEKHSGEFMPGWSARSAGPRSLAPFGSVGGMYSAVADLVFGDPLEAGKVMGLAPFGRPVHPPSAFFRIDDEGAVHYRDELCARYRDLAMWPDNQEAFQDLAASVQAALEQAVLAFANRARALTGLSRLCFAGGVALNSIANERLHALGLDDVFIMPAAEDSGPAIGAAYYGLAQLTGRVASRRLGHDRVGRSYPSAEIERAIEATPHVIVASSGDILDEIVARLIAGEILGWFHGGSELGPRALGQRSILCDARHADAKLRLNDRVKHREAFRPFAPAILLEEVDEWFVTPPQFRDSPAMLRVLAYQPGRAERVPAAAHVDGTGRVQTVGAEVPELRQLLERYHARTRVPILVNTSFNIAGEPIVETPDDALWCLLATDLDAVVLGDRLVRRAPAHQSLLQFVPRLRARQVEMTFPIIDGGLRLDAAAEVGARITTTTRYGELVVPVRPIDVRLLRACDGSRDGYEIHATIPTLTETQLVRRLALFRRAQVLELRSPSSGAAPRSARR